MNSISTLLKQKPIVQVVGHSTTKPFFVYDDMPIMSLGLGFRRPKSALWSDEFVNDIHRPSRDLNPWQVHAPGLKSNFGDIMRYRLLDEYVECLYNSRQTTYLDTEYVYRLYGRPMDITPEFLKMEDYLNKDCYPKPSNDIILWSRYPHVPQLKGLPECPTLDSYSTVTNRWHLKKKMI